jgi:hypothetical protein
MKKIIQNIMEDLENQIHSYDCKEPAFIIHLWNYEVEEILKKHLGDEE